MLKKGLSLILTAVLFLGMFSGTVLATDTATYESPSEIENDDPLYSRMNQHENNAQDDSLDAPLVAGNAPTNFDEAYPKQVPGATIRYGIDVSAWQGTIDWAAVAGSGVEFVIIRAAWRGYGTGSLSVDEYFYQNIEGAKANGLKVGVYIFSQAITPEEGIEEANFLMNTIRGYDIDLPLVIDYEFAYHADGSPGRLRAANLSRQAGTDICNAFCAEVEKNGYQSMVYANPSMLYNYLYRDQLGRLWLANYTSQTSYEGDYDFWQFTSSGVLPGITGTATVDMNFWFDTGRWVQDGYDWYYYEGDQAVTGWKEIDDTWYYFQSNGIMSTHWQKINDKWYYFGGGGSMATGWQQVDGIWYYMYSSGSMATGWQYIDGAWYYFNPGGSMATGWQNLDGAWYYMYGSGPMATGWQYIDGTWYYMYSSGPMATNWQYINGRWYYLYDTGTMVTGWEYLGGSWYYFNNSGAMLTGRQTINGTSYTFNSDGVWIS